MNPIPVRCFTCSKVLADKYQVYANEVRKRKIEKYGDDASKLDKVIYLTNTMTEKTIEGNVLDELGLNKMCCRRHILSKV